ncbi:MAG: hypothetical protein E7627_00650 [Ruminococcaceae bacterium]|nr:hypothetical protein [Oscillospiraceae bacterium]
MSEIIYSENFDFIKKRRADIDSLERGLLCDSAKSLAAKACDLTLDDIIEACSSLSHGDVMVSREFCKILAGEIKDSIQRLFYDNPTDNDDEEHTQIAYLKNAFSDKAYRRFAELFPKASAAYYPGFREVCEEVYYGRCTHTILPIYSTVEGHIATFRKLISKYDLKIVSATDIVMSDESVMRYALLTKELENPGKSESLRYLELSVVVDDTIKCGEFLAATEYLGAVVSSVTSYPLEYSENGNLLWLQLDITEADLTALYLFFECYQIRYTIIGAYKII